MKRLVLCVLAVFCLYPGGSRSQWIERTNGLPSEYFPMAIDACSRDAAVLAASAVYRTTNGGLSWEMVKAEGAGGTGPVDISMTDPTHIWVCTANGEIHATTDGGTTWTKQWADSSRTRFMNYIKMFDPSTGIAMGDALTGTGAAVFLKTTDAGAHWISMNDSAFGGRSQNIWRCVEFPTSLAGYYFETGISPEALWKTTDAGATWTKLAYPHPSAWTIEFASTNVGLLYPNYSGVLCRTRDGGITWETLPLPMSADVPVIDIEFTPGDPSRLWMADNEAIRFSNDTGRTWTISKIARAMDLVFTDENNGWAAGENFVLWTSNRGVTSVHMGEETPSTTILEQNYPNPFNPITNIRFQISDIRYLKLGVYDLLGREVAVLVNEVKTPGVYAVTFDAKDLASGVYVYRLQGGGFVEGRKMVVMR